MLFDAQITILSGQLGVDPRTNPGDVPDSQLLRIPRGRPGASADAIRRVLFALEGNAAETVTADLYAMDEAFEPARRDDPTVLNPALRRFYLFAPAVVFTVGQLFELARTIGVGPNQVAVPVPAGGILYPRVTADTLTVPAVLKARGAG